MGFIYVCDVILQLDSIAPAGCFFYNRRVNVQRIPHSEDQSGEPGIESDVEPWTN